MADSVVKLPRLYSPSETSKNEGEIMLAAIDIGTNSIHMVIVRLDPTLPAFTIVSREKDTVRLGESDATGSITIAAQERAIASLKRCQDLALSFRVKDIIATATSAVREAVNGKEFLQKIEAELGLKVDLISGQEEARRIYLGVLSGMDFNNLPHIIIDIGGGSTELILADREEARFLSSTKIGAVRLTREFVTTDPINEQELTYLRAYIRGMLERPVEQIKAALKPGEKPCLVGTSGTITALVETYARSKSGTLPSPMNGFRISLTELQNITQRLLNLTIAQRSLVPGMSEKRAEIIVPGALILTEAMDMLGVDRLTLCERALREGIIVDWMLNHGLIADKMRYQGEVRQRNVYKLAQKYQVQMDYSQKVADFALSLFDQLQGKLHFWREQERELLWAAALLHNSGLYISHEAHHKHSYYLIRYGELLGFTETEVEIIANIARYHRKSKPKKKHSNYQNLSSKFYRAMVNQLSAILRIAIALDRRQIGAIKEVQCLHYPQRRQLQLLLTPTEPGDRCDLELWNLDYKKLVFEEEFGVKIVPSLSGKLPVDG